MEAGRRRPVARGRGLYHICFRFVNQSITAYPALPVHSRTSVAVAKSPPLFPRGPEAGVFTKKPPNKKNTIVISFPHLQTNASRHYARDASGGTPSPRSGPQAR